MASLGDVFSGSFLSLFRKVTNTMFGIRYTLDSDLLAARVLENAKDMPVEFVKTFYNMPELELIPSRRKRSPGIKANYVIEIPPEPMAVMNTQGAAFQVPVPKSHLGPGKAVQVRLISPFRSEGMIGKCSNCVPNVWPGSNCSCQITPESDAIFLHLHGGGFVSQTSKSHEPYLKAWAKTLGIPILSVDYSLAPEAPFPRAVEEVLFAYCWMRNNFKLLGTTGRKVIIGGDSAGGNLSVGLILQCIQLSLPKPDHLVAFYPSLLCQMYPSPSRLICLLDPLVMFPCLLRCLNCYADPNYMSTCPRTFVQELESCQNYTDPLLSPLLTSPELLSLFPPTSLFSSDIDPCLDETVSFSNKLMTAGIKVTLEVLSGLPHGFLSLTGMSKDCALAVEHITEKMRDIVLT
ncbi:hormone-sensitive lipase-like [Tigriopus californicus]|uniref:hormone-sensitive lipase-like n=1 Tax=Tigriopus californicus TaxID=6832 RepID=UPI0027DA717D|nr:hormone-sensitive lipase-like [Tigriopus californicus]XP_059082510.1 hormone-sensitive lipase-like [Tigriopus californicus]